MKENSGVRFPIRPDQTGAERRGEPHDRPAGQPPMPDVIDRNMAGRLAGQIAEIPDIRADLVDRTRLQIQAGNYDTPRKLDLAVTRMINEFVEETNR
ncbi:MAG: flagellar biosynthesis anti-sigma factor FlgM [Planctomycetes bacterium]|nr:flagellar biosynthesis anti-sigma factor FlgM [Planctomycetota bacterium]